MLLLTLDGNCIDWDLVKCRAREREVTLDVAAALAFIAAEFGVELPSGVVTELRRASAGVSELVLHRIKLAPHRRSRVWKAVYGTARKWDVVRRTSISARRRDVVG
jgi:hypothetical protein